MLTLRIRPYTIFLADLADSEETTGAHGTIAGMLTLRLVDQWFLAGASEVSPDTLGMNSVRTAVMRVSTSDPIRLALFGVINAMQTLVVEDVVEILHPLMSYAEVLVASTKPALAAAVFQAVVDYAPVDAVSGISILATLRLATCRRVLGDLDAAQRDYRVAVKRARLQSKRSLELLGRTGLARVVLARGGVTEADALLNTIVRDCQVHGDQEAEVIALEAQAGVAKQLGDADRAVCLSYRALELTQNETEREMLLGDLGVFFLELGRWQAAQDALMIQEATAMTEMSRLFARVNLVALAGRSNDEKLFRVYVAKLEGSDLPPELRGNYWIERARGLAIFGDTEEARGLFMAASALAAKYGFARMSAEAATLLEGLRAPWTRTLGRPAAELSGPAERVECALRMRAIELAA